MSEYDKNFTFRMPGELREAITRIAQIEDRSLSQVAEYFMWSGFDRYCRDKRLLSPLEVRALSDSYKDLIAALDSNERPDKSRLRDLIQVEEKAG